MGIKTIVLLLSMVLLTGCLADKSSRGDDRRGYRQGYGKHREHSDRGRYSRPHYGHYQRRRR